MSLAVDANQNNNKKGDCMKKVLSIIVLLGSQFAFGESKPFSEVDYNSSIASKEAFVVAFHSDNCGSCKIQKPNLESALKEEPLKQINGYMANFEATSEFRKKLEKPVRGPSTILIFKNGKEVARILGETKKEIIK